MKTMYPKDLQPQYNRYDRHHGREDEETNGHEDEKKDVAAYAKR